MAYQMIDGFNYDGFWWKPNNPDEKIFGNICYNPTNGSLLSLFGHFSDIKSIFAPETRKIPFLHGITKDGLNVTLVENLPSNFEFKFGGVSTEKFFPQYVLIGGYVNSLRDLVSCECEFYLTGLEEWLQHRSIQIKNYNDSGKLTRVDIELPSEEIFYVKDFDGSLHVKASSEIRGSHFREIYAKTSSLLIWKADTPQNLEWYISLISRIRNLVALCLADPVYIGKVSFYINHKDAFEIDKSIKCIDIYYQQNPIPSMNEIDYSKDIISIEDLSYANKDFLTSWLKLYSNIEPVLNILTSVIYSKMYLDVRFLLSAQAVEGLHRSLWPSTYVDENEFRVIEEKMLGSIPSDIPQTLKTKLTYGIRFSNYFSLRQRLKQIAMYFDDNKMSDIVIIDKNFINDVCNTRNYLTHYDERLRDQAKEGEDLYKIHIKIIIILVAYLLQEMGLPPEIIRDKLGRNKHFGNYIGR